MFKMYKGGSVITADKSQVAQLKKAGWSTKAPKAEAPKAAPVAEKVVPAKPKAVKPPVEKKPVVVEEAPKVVRSEVGEGAVVGDGPKIKRRSAKK